MKRTRVVSRIYIREFLQAHSSLFLSIFFFFFHILLHLYRVDETYKATLIAKWKWFSIKQNFRWIHALLNHVTVTHRAVILFFSSSFLFYSCKCTVLFQSDWLERSSSRRRHAVPKKRDRSVGGIGIPCRVSAIPGTTS